MLGEMFGSFLLVTFFWLLSSGSFLLTFCECMQTDRLIYASRFVRVIYNSCIVLNRPGTVTPLRLSGLRVHVRLDGPASAALVQAVLPARLLVVLPARAIPLPASDSAPTLVIVGQTSAKCTSPSPTQHLMEDLPAVLSARASAMLLALAVFLIAHAAVLPPPQHFTCLSR